MLMKSLKVFSVLVMLVVIGTAVEAAQVVKCFSCEGPAKSDKCEFNGKQGTWGKDETIGGVVYHVCIIPGIAVIRPNDAFLTDAQLYAHAAQFRNARYRIDFNAPQTPPTQQPAPPQNPPAKDQRDPK